MQTGKKINQISNRFRRRSRAIQETIGISGAQGNILNYILVESQNRSVYQKDIEQEFGLRPSTATKALKSLKKNELMGSMKVSNVIAKMAIPSVISKSGQVRRCTSCKYNVQSGKNHCGHAYNSQVQEIIHLNKCKKERLFMEERDDLEQMAFIQKWNDGKAEREKKREQMWNGILEKAGIKKEEK